MRIHSVRLENFRAIKNCEMPMDPHTVIIGSNNGGKSTFLKGLELFFDNAPKVTVDDFHGRNTQEAISISVVFGDLTPEEQERFATNLMDGKLQITRELLYGSPRESGQFFVHRLANPDFNECRNEQAKTPKRDLYKALRENPKYVSLPAVSSADDINQKLEEWEAQNPSCLELMKLSTFRGAKNVAIGELKKKTDFVFVPAVREAANELGNQKNSPAKQLIDNLARQTIENDSDYQKFILDANKKIKNLTDPTQVGALGEISIELSRSLQQFYQDAELVATWDPLDQIPISFPSSKIDVKSAGHPSPVEFVGHGLQRAVIITILDFLARRKASDNGEFSEPQSDLIIGFEEPDIYQHPTKQRHFAKVLQKLAEGFNNRTGIRLQIISVTHSPLFVSLPRFGEVRILKRHPERPSETTLSQVTLKECSEALAAYAGAVSPWRVDTIAAKLHIFSSELCEGFFANKVVLVEGASDRAFLEAAYMQKERSPIEEGISILSCEGKTNIVTPAFIFDRLKIPTYVVIDNDSNHKGTKDEEKSVRFNRMLQKICGIDDRNIVDWPVCCEARFASWDQDMEHYLKLKSQGKYDEAVRKAKKYYELTDKSSIKLPAIASTVLTHLFAEKVLFPELDDLINAIDKL